MFLELLVMSKKEIWGGFLIGLGVLELAFERRALGDRGGSGVWGERARRLRISYSCPSSGDVLIRHLAVAASCGVIEVILSFFMVSCEKSL